MDEIRWFPPSWLLIRAGGKVAYVDPAWLQSHYTAYPHKVVFSRHPDPMDGLPEPDLPRADVILYTHHHQDHIKSTTLRRLAGPRTSVIAPERCRRFIDRPFDVIAEGETRDVAGLHVRAVPAYNTPAGRSTRKNHHRADGVGYLIRAGGLTIYHAGDTDVIPEMRALGPVDVAFLPIGGTFTMDVAEAVEALRVIRPGLAVPMHHLHADPRDFARRAAAAGLAVRVLGIGGRVALRR